MKRVAVLSNAIPDGWFEGQEVKLVRDIASIRDGSVQPRLPACESAGYLEDELGCQMNPVPLRAGMCAFLAFLPGVLKQVDGLVLSTCCDQMRRVAEWLDADERVFLFNVPSTYHQERLLEAEKVRLMRWIRALPQTKNRSKYSDTSAISARTQGGRDERPGGADSLAIGVLGGHFCGDRERVETFFAHRGVRVALWACEGGEVIGNLFQRPNAVFFDQVHSTVAKRHLDGLVVVRTTWCDIWRLAYVRLHEVLQVPILDLHTAKKDSLNHLYRGEA